MPEFTKRVVRTITEHNGKKPFFIYMPLNAPHSPVTPSPQWQGKSGAGPNGDFRMEVDWSVGEVTHRAQLEVFHVIEGGIQFEVNGELFERGTGAAAVVPAGAVHAFRNIGAVPAVIHFEMLPAGDSEEAFRRIATGEIGDVEAFFDKYGMDLCGPPLG